MLSGNPAWLAAGSAASWDPNAHTLTVTGSATIVADPGADAPNIIASGPAARLTIAPALVPADVHLGGLTLTGGAAIGVPGAGDTRPNATHTTLVLGTLGASADPTLSIDAASTLDLGDCDLIVHTGGADAGGANAYATLYALAKQGRHGDPGQPDGTWSGTGLCSSAATSVDAAAGYEQVGLGVAVNSTLVAGAYPAWQVGPSTEPLGGGDVIVKYTYLGDYALAGAVDSDDAAILQGEYDAGLSATHTWATGCSLYDGLCDTNEAGLFQAQYGLGPAALASGPRPAVTSVVVNGNLTGSLAGAQRSMVDGLLYTFNEPVKLNATTAFSIIVPDGQTGTVPDLAWAAVRPDAGGYATQWAVTFSGPGVSNGSIANGVYTITLATPAVTAEDSTAFAWLHNPDTFYRLYGDADGNGTVDGNGSDYARFQASTTTYDPAFDCFGTGQPSGTAEYNAFEADLNVSYAGVIRFSPAALMPTNVAAGVNDPASAQIAWTASTDPSVTGYAVERWSNTTGWTTLTPTLPATATSYTDATAQPGTTYEYAVQALTALTLGTTALSSDWAGPSNDVVMPPLAPANLVVLGTNAASVSLAWDAVPGANGYTVYRQGPNDAGFTAITTQFVTGTSYVDTSAASDMVYNYQVTATFPAGESAPGDAVAAQTLSDPAAGYDMLWSYTHSPQTVDTFSSAATGGLELGVQFTSDVAGYLTGLQFYKGVQNTGTHVGDLWDASGNLLATATFGDESQSGWQQVDFTPAVAVRAGQTYTASYFGTSGHYPADANYFATTGTDNAPLHAASGINGVFAFGPSAFPTQASQSTNYWVQPVFYASAHTAPDAPTGLTATAVSAYEVDLAWSSNADPLSYFEVERSTDGGQTFDTIDQTAAGVRTYIDMSVTDGQSYLYKVVAVTPAGATSGESNVAAVTTPRAVLDGLTATAVSSSEIDLTWTDNSGGTAPVDVWRSIDDATWTHVASVPAGTTQYADRGLASDTAYCYYLSTPGAPAGTAASNQTAAVTLPTAPTGLTATPSGGDVTLAWSDAAGDNDGYEILGSSDGYSFSVVADVAAGTTTYDDAMAADGVTDYYKVCAFGLGGDSAPTAVASATPIAAIQAVDDTPANGITYNVLHGKTVTIRAADLLANDNDPNNNPIPSIQSFTQPSHGTLTDNGDGTLTYTAETTYVGPDSFTYTPTDQYGASSNAATVQVQVTDQMPEASSAIIPVVEARDANGNWLSYPAAVTGTLSASDPDGDPLTFSASVVSGAGGFAYDSSTGAYTFTPSQSDPGPVVIVFTANDGALTSNQASLIFPGYHPNNTDPDEPDNDGDELIGGVNVPLATNQQFNVFQNGQLLVYPSAGLVSVAKDTDPTSPPDNDSPSPGPVVENPQHGSVSVDSYGSFTYTPDAGFVGRDWFTWQVQDGGKLGEYATVFIDVQPLTVSLSVNQLKPGDPSAEVPNDQFPPDAAGDPQYATINLNISASPGLPQGSTVTLSVNSDVQNDLDVYDGAPGASGTNLLFGKDAGSDSYTWSLVGTEVQPRAVYAVGLAGTDYDQAVFTLSVSVGTTTIGVASGNAPAAIANPQAQTQSVSTTQPTTLPGKGGFLEAFDGSTDSEDDNTNIRQFYLRYTSPNKDYQRGVGNSKDRPHVVIRLPMQAIGDHEAKVYEEIALGQITTFYNIQGSLTVPLDTVGYSRGAMEAVKLVNDLSTTGIADYRTKQTVNGEVIVAYIHPKVRYVGLISPVMGPLELQPLWPKSLPDGVALMFQALDNFPNNPILPQHTITRAPGTKGKDIIYALGHSPIGRYQGVLDEMIAEAFQVGVPVQ